MYSQHCYSYYRFLKKLFLSEQWNSATSWNAIWQPPRDEILWKLYAGICGVLYTRCQIESNRNTLCWNRFIERVKAYENVLSSHPAVFNGFQRCTFFGGLVVAQPPGWTVILGVARSSSRQDGLPVMPVRLTARQMCDSCMHFSETAGTMKVKIPCEGMTRASFTCFPSYFLNTKTIQIFDCCLLFGCQRVSLQ